MKTSTKAGLDYYAKERVPPGDFLRAVLENDLMEAFGRADIENRRDMFEILNYVYNNMPYSCHGSPLAVEEWLGRKE